MFPVGPEIARAFLLEELGLGGVVGLVAGLVVGRLLGQSHKLAWLDVALGGVGAVLAGAVLAALERHAVHDGAILGVRDLVINYPAAFAVTCAVGPVVASRLIWNLTRHAGVEKSRAA